jgi:hypothetical protein
MKAAARVRQALEAAAAAEQIRRADEQAYEIWCDRQRLARGPSTRAAFAALLEAERENGWLN